ncbi:MAG TPA: AmmeMemoRadiSam system protein B [Candidatus Aminicenantes bacterium]|nr:AmmeMemoRadiSam system protein B [Candidatus Aminicenantes bacterium]
MTRRPYVAGQFYPGTRDRLRKALAALTVPGAPRKKALAVVSPHAGYVYSGGVAGAVFSSVEPPPVFVILGPAHRKIGPLFALQAEGSWLTPLGESPIETGLASRVLAGCPLVEADERAHLEEHSLEVQLPFIQYLREDAAIVPVCVSAETDYAALDALGRALAEAVRSYGKEALIVASTDMSHYVAQKTAERQDRRAIDRILELDPAGLFDTVEEGRISMCGVQPTAAALVAALALGARRAELVRYATSGDASGDYSQVVGYAGITIS